MSDTSAAPDFSLRPVFIGWITLLVQLPIQIFFTIWCGVFFGSIFQLFFRADDQLPFIFFGALTFFGLPLVAYVGQKLNYARTEYRFYADRVEFDEGFFTFNRKVIFFNSVKEVTLRKGVLQRIYGLGTVYLATLATGSTTSSNAFTALGFGNVSASGISVRDVPDPDQVYARIRTLVDATNR